MAYDKLTSEEIFLLLSADRHVQTLQKAVNIMEKGAYDHWINLDQGAYKALKEELATAYQDYDAIVEAIWQRTK